MTYAELVTRITDTTEDRDPTFAANIDWFIKDAEQRIYAEVNLPLERKNVTSGVTIGNPYIALPTDYIYTYGFNLIDGTGAASFLLRKEVEFIREMYPIVGYTGAPKYYGQFDIANFIVGPTPDAAYVVELHYFAYPASIVTAGTTWLGTNYAQLLLNGTLLNANVFMKGAADVMSYYKTAYDNDLATLKQYAGQRIVVDDYREGRIS